MSFYTIRMVDGRIHSISNDPDGVLGTFFAFCAIDLVKSEDKLDFIKQFSPLGDGYYIYDVASSFRDFYPPSADDPEPQAEDEWSVQLESVNPAITVHIAGRVLRNLLGQMVKGLLPYHSDFQEIADYLESSM